MVPQALHPTGHRKVSEEATNIEHHRRGAEMPKDDANANKTFFGPSGLLKGAGSGRFRTGLSHNAPRLSQSAGGFQKARSKRK